MSPTFDKIILVMIIAIILISVITIGPYNTLIINVPFIVAIAIMRILVKKLVEESS